MLDLTPATDAVARVVTAVRDDQLDGPTPCPQLTVAALLDHLDGLAQAFVAAARKTPVDAGSSVDATRLGDDWRTRIPARLTALAAAWQDGDAWTGMTAAGGVDLPGEVAGLVALDEVVVHGWDLARATGQQLRLPDLGRRRRDRLRAAGGRAAPRGLPGAVRPTGRGARRRTPARPPRRPGGSRSVVDAGDALVTCRLRALRAPRAARSWQCRRTPRTSARRRPRARRPARPLHQRSCASRPLDGVHGGGLGLGEVRHAPDAHPAPAGGVRRSAGLRAPGASNEPSTSTSSGEHVDTSSGTCALAPYATAAAEVRQKTTSTPAVRTEVGGRGGPTGSRAPTRHSSANAAGTSTRTGNAGFSTVSRAVLGRQPGQHGRGQDEQRQRSGDEHERDEVAHLSQPRRSLPPPPELRARRTCTCRLPRRTWPGRPSSRLQRPWLDVTSAHTGVLRPCPGAACLCETPPAGAGPRSHRGDPPARRPGPAVDPRAGPAALLPPSRAAPGGRPVEEP